MANNRDNAHQDSSNRQNLKPQLSTSERRRKIPFVPPEDRTIIEKGGQTSCMKNK